VAKGCVVPAAAVKYIENPFPLFLFSVRKFTMCWRWTEYWSHETLNVPPPLKKYIFIYTYIAAYSIQCILCKAIGNVKCNKRLEQYRMYRITHRWRRSEWSHHVSWSLTKFSSVLGFLLLFIYFIFFMFIYVYVCIYTMIETGPFYHKRLVISFGK
jgi:hypothetical protein